MSKRKPRNRALSRARKYQKVEHQGEPEALHTTEDSNDAFENFKEFYRQQNILEDWEWKDFLYYLHQPLPVTFRVTQNIGSEDSYKHYIGTSRELFTNKEIYVDERMIEPPFFLTWCNAWQLGCDLKTLKYSDHPKLREIYQWILKFTSLGTIIRQETVSMLPVAFLQIQPHHKVLDLCAAPGSKTTQVMDGLFAKGADSVSGFVIANDLDPRRAYMLTRRCAVLSNACQHLMITSHKAQMFPDVHHDPQNATAKRPTNGGFDRIVCDVPCCGDGTLRKSRALFHRWHPFFGIGLHSLQLQIAMRGISLLNIGGIIAYSTCTFNPIENEAVVVSILERCGDSIELLDCSTLFPEIERRPGIHTWKIFDDDMRYYPTYEDSQHPSTPEKQRICFRRTMWPRSDYYPLERCMRFLPHLQDTGGFFVALLRKKGPLPMPPPTNKGKPQKIISTFETEHRYYPLTNKALEALQLYFKISKSSGFFSKVVPNLFMRSSEIGTISYFGKSLRKHCFGNPSSGRLHPVNAGVKVFTFNKKHETYTITQDGARMFHAYIKKPKIEMPSHDLIILLENLNEVVPLDSFSEKSQKLAMKLFPGSCIIHSDDIYVAARRIKDPPALKIQIQATKGLETLPDAFAQTLIHQLQRT